MLVLPLGVVVAGGVVVVVFVVAGGVVVVDTGEGVEVKVKARNVRIVSTYLS